MNILIDSSYSSDCLNSGCKYTCHLRCKDEVLLECDGGLIRDAKEMSREEITLKTLEILSQVQWD